MEPAMQDRHLIPARKGAAARLKKGQVLTVINTHGAQVVDFWAFNDPDLGECMSMEHTRASLCRIIPKVGDHLVTNQRRPILTLIEDTSPGIHDTMIASCDNLFMNIPVKNGVDISFEPPVTKPGDYVRFRAEMNCVVGFSACPQDMLPINGKDCVIHDAHYTIEG